MKFTAVVALSKADKAGTIYEFTLFEFIDKVLTCSGLDKDLQRLASLK